MARTWSLLTTLTVASGMSIPPNLRALTNAAQTLMYFKISASPQKIYKWDGSNLTDIAGSSFPVTGAIEFIGDICIFDGDLFTAYGPQEYAAAPGELGTGIYRYNGSGTSWTKEYDLENEPGASQEAGFVGTGYSGGSDPDSWVWPMDCDANYLAVTGTASFGSAITGQTENRLWTRDTAGNWQLNEIQSAAYEAPGWHLVGNSKGSDYGLLWGYDRLSGSDFRPMERGSPDPWSYLTGSGIGRRIPIGYGGGFSFFSHNTSGTTWELKRSTDFGANLSAAGGLTRTGSGKASFKFKNLGGGIIMLSLTSNQAYTFDPATNAFVADGTTGSQSIYDFFILNGELLALTNSATANSVDIWTAGSVTGVKFYTGVNSLSFASDIPIAGIEPGAIAGDIGGKIILGSSGPSSKMVVQASSPYSAWSDLTGIVPGTGAKVTSTRLTGMELKN